MKKGFKYFLFIFVGIIILGLVVSVGTLQLPSLPSDDDTGSAQNGVTDEVVTKYYPVSTVLDNVTLTSYSSLKVSDNNKTINLNFAAAEGYSLPLDVTVTGCEYMWNHLTGQLFLALATKDVTVSITAVEDTSGDGSGSTDTPVETTYYSITTSLTKTIAHASNASQISSKEGYVELKFTPSEGYSLPTSITVTGCTYLWNYSTGVLTLSAPTGDISVTIISKEITYSVTQKLTNVTGKSTNSDTIPASFASMNHTYYFYAAEGYELPSTITVKGAEYSWIKSSGMLVLTNITGNVTITIEGDPITYNLHGVYVIQAEPDLEALAELWGNADADYLFVNFDADCEVWQGMFVDDVDDDGMLELCYYVPASWGEKEGTYEAVYSPAYGWKDEAYKFVNFGQTITTEVTEAFYVPFMTIATKQ